MKDWRRVLTLIEHYLLRFLGAVVGFVAVVVAFAVWQLSRGPVSLDQLAPHLARALSNPDSGVTVTVDHTLLSFGDGTVELVARGVHLAMATDQAQLMLGELDLSLSTRAAFHGMIAPTRIKVVEPHLHLERDQAGEFHLGFGAATAAGATAGAADDWTTRLIDDLAQPPNRHEPFGYLIEAAMTNASVDIDDKSLGITWHADHSNIVLHRGADGIRGDLTLLVDTGGAQTRLDGVVSYRQPEAALGLVLRFADLRPAVWARTTPALASLAAADLPISGEVRATLDTRNRLLHDIACDLTLGGGAIRHATLVGGALTVTGGALQAGYDAPSGRLTVSHADLDLGGPRLTVTATVDGLGDKLLVGQWPQTLAIDGTLGLQSVRLNDFPKLWPAGLSDNTREWVTGHVHDGVLDDGEVQLGVHLDLRPDAPYRTVLDHFGGTLAYTNLAIDYFPPLAMVRGVGGTATFDAKHIDFLTTTGVINDLKVTGGTVTIYQLDTDDQKLSLDLGLTGPLTTILTVLDTKPLGYIHSLGLDPTQVKGSFDGRMKFGFPLLNRLRFAQVDYSAAADIADLAIAKVLANRDLTAGVFKLQLDRNALRLDGNARLNDVPLAVVWQQNFKITEGVSALYVVHGEIDDAGRARLGLDFADGSMNGPVGVDVDYVTGQRQHAAVVLDLKKADGAVELLGWTKPAGMPATARMQLDFVDDRLTELHDGQFKGGGLETRFAVSFGDSSGGPVLTHVDVKQLVVGKTDVSGSIAHGADGWQVDIAGPSFDASPLLARMNKNKNKKADVESHDPPLLINATLDRLVLGDQREAHDVRGALSSDGIHYQAATLDTTMASNARLKLRFGASGGERKLALTTDDFGEMLRLFDVTTNIKGGRFDLAATAVDDGPRRSLRGQVEATDYRIVSAPWFTRLLSLASFSGIGAMLEGEGIPFAKLSGDFVYADGVITATDLRTSGSAIGINTGGTVDYDRGTIDISGTLVPAYTLNSVLGNIPVLGNLLIGEGQGVFGVNFRVAGALSEPRISVNPLSALAPGVLRRLFLFDAPKPGTASPPPPAPQAQVPTPQP